MPLSREMQRLRAEHAALVTLSRIVLDMTRAPQLLHPAELASARGLLREALVRHLKCEDWVLYPWLVATGDAVLVCPKERSQDVKQLVEELARRGKHDVL